MCFSSKKKRRRRRRRRRKSRPPNFISPSFRTSNQFSSFSLECSVEDFGGLCFQIHSSTAAKILLFLFFLYFLRSVFGKFAFPCGMHEKVSVCIHRKEKKALFFFFLFCLKQFPLLFSKKLFFFSRLLLCKWAPFFLPFYGNSWIGQVAKALSLHEITKPHSVSPRKGGKNKEKVDAFFLPFSLYNNYGFP